MDPLESDLTFTYLVRTIVYNNRKWEGLYQNMRNVQRRWGMVSGVLVKIGETVRVGAMLYKALVQVVLLYGSEIWVKKEAMMKVKEGLYYHITWRVVGIQHGKLVWRFGSVYPWRRPHNSGIRQAAAG